ncbi:hypothetical protein D8M04_11680 [Oceanobacillus piezotolerans]|uniref:Uncharacterized protein n=1 Tax=Oceanobacillus piezotolerans TaxID=2448030 RepID=A0A498DG31_9BACI|nr:hypothetical protein D8M04_11680 [Oceanobacillus piezotolerans]
MERYYLWSYSNNHLYRGDIHHKKWKVHDADVVIYNENMTPFLPENTIIGNPVFHYASSRQVLFWPIKKVD